MYRVSQKKVDIQLPSLISLFIFVWSISETAVVSLYMGGGDRLMIGTYSYAYLLELITFEILAAERLRLMGFDNRLIIDCFANVVNILIWLFSTNDRLRSAKYESNYLQCLQSSRSQVGGSNLDFCVKEKFQKTLNPWTERSQLPPETFKTAVRPLWWVAGTERHSPPLSPSCLERY